MLGNRNTAGGNNQGNVLVLVFLGRPQVAYLLLKIISFRLPTSESGTWLACQALGTELVSAR